ncbi:MAG TPA: hypothetical protein VH374_05865 [Polyangia bacterium]|nr:hypothetical protein [Polyangia bacterium]
MRAVNLKRRPLRRRWLLLLTTSLLAGGAACSSNNDGGIAPTLLKMWWTQAHTVSGQALIWSANPDAGAPPATVTPNPLEFDLVYDRSLDGDKIEDTVVSNGIEYTVPKAMPPVTVTWDGMPLQTDQGVVGLSVSYNSLNLPGEDPGTTYVFGHPLVGFPSSTTLTFHFDKAFLTGSNHLPMIGPDAVSVTTGPFTVSIAVPAGGDGGPAAMIATDYQIPLVFSNRTAATAAVKPFVSLTVDGAAADFALVINGDSDLTTVYLGPPQLGTLWPPGARLELAVSAGLPDIFGAPLGTGASASFVTKGTHKDAGAPETGAGDDAAVSDAADDVN